MYKICNQKRVSSAENSSFCNSILIGPISELSTWKFTFLHLYYLFTKFSELFNEWFLTLHGERNPLPYSKSTMSKPHNKGYWTFVC